MRSSNNMSLTAVIASIIFSVTIASGAMSIVNASESAMSYVEIDLEGSCGFGSKAFKTFLENEHDERDIRATIKWKVYNQPYRTTTKRIYAGERKQIGCSAAARITGARFLN